MPLLTITREANQGRLGELQRDAQRVADPRGAAPGEVESAVRRLPAVVWLAHSVHGGEAPGVEAGLGLLYQLAAGTDDETRMALDSTLPNARFDLPDEALTSGPIGDGGSLAGRVKAMGSVMASPGPSEVPPC